MTTISERLREIDEEAMYCAPATSERTIRRAADTIDALVAALERIRDMCPVTCDMTLAHEMTEEAASALALAKGERA